jgi:hypothetical protein
MLKPWAIMQTDSDFVFIVSGKSTTKYAGSDPGFGADTNV